MADMDAQAMTEQPSKDRLNAKKRNKDIIQQIMDFNFRRKKAEVQPTLLPTLPNLYGLDVRFRAVERMQKEEKDRRSIRRNSVANQADVLMGDQSKPQNRHGSVKERKNRITTTSYKKKMRIEPG